MTANLSEAGLGLAASPHDAATLNNMTEPAILIDSFSVVTFLNTAAKRLTGWDEETVGKDLTEVFHLIDKDSRQRIDPAIEVLSQGTTCLVVETPRRGQRWEQKIDRGQCKSY